MYDFSEAVFQEALLNALAHRSYEDMAPIYVKHYPTKIVIENPGGFPGDINESNIITHQSIPRNKLIAMTLQHLKYVQHSGQGVDIMFQSMLTEGKPYPEYASTPNSVRLTLRSTMENQSFVRFIAETQDKRSKIFTLSELMILHYLREHQKITLKQAAKTIQKTDDNAHKVLNALRDEALLIKNKKARSLLFISFTILSLLGVLCLFPFVAIYTPLPFSYYPFFCNVLIALMGIFSILGITSSRSIQNNLVKRVVIVLFSIVVGVVGIVFLLQIL